MKQAALEHAAHLNVEGTPLQTPLICPPLPPPNMCSSLFGFPRGSDASSERRARGYGSREGDSVVGTVARGERRNPSRLFAAEDSAAGQLTQACRSVASSGKASIQTCEPCPNQSAAIVMMKIPQELQCYMDILPPRFRSHFFFFFITWKTLILHHMMTLFSLS